MNLEKKIDEYSRTRNYKLKCDIDRCIEIEMSKNHTKKSINELRKIILKYRSILTDTQYNGYYTNDTYDTNSTNDDYSQTEPLLASMSETKFSREKSEELVQRDAQIGDLVNDLEDLRLIFVELQSQVHQQGIILDRIEDNMTSASENVEDGRKQLEKANQHSKNATSKLKYIAGITGIGAIVGTVLGLKFFH